MKIVFYLAEKLMLTAWNAENYLGSLFYRIHERIVCSSVAGMKSYHHVCLIIGVIGNVSHDKLQLAVTQALCNVAAEFYNIFL